MSLKTDEAKMRMAKECQGKEELVPIEEYLTSICTTDAVAEKILDKKKTLKGCLGHMRGIAQKKAVHGFACIPPEEGFKIIREYYGITDTDKSHTAGKVIDIMDYI